MVKEESGRWRPGKNPIQLDEASHFCSTAALTCCLAGWISNKPGSRLWISVNSTEKENIQLMFLTSYQVGTIPEGQASFFC